MHLSDALNFILPWVYFLIILGVLVLVHEFGHFAVAKLCGVRVEAFSIGMGKRLFGFRIGETDYRICLLPFGGYVKFSGELGFDGNELNLGSVAPTDPGDLNAHPRWQRVLIALAGPVSNFILAFVIMVFIALCHHEVEQYLTRPAVVDWVVARSSAASAGVQHGDTIVHYDAIENPTWRDVDEQSRLNLNQTIPISYLHNGQRINTVFFVKNTGSPDDFDLKNVGLVPVLQDAPVGVMQVTSGMPAAEAGLQANDRIFSIDGIQLHSVEAIIAYLQDQNGQAALNVVRNNAHVIMLIDPELADAGDGTRTYQLGFRSIEPPTDIVHLPLRAAIAYSRKENWHRTTLVAQLIHHMFGGKVSVKSLSGPVGIEEEIGIAAKMGLWPLLDLTAFISLQLGLLNLLPFPILDGGMILFMLIESILRRDVNQAWKERIYQAAFVVLLLFFAYVTFNDIAKFPIFSRLKL